MIKQKDISLSKNKNKIKRISRQGPVYLDFLYIQIEEWKFTIIAFDPEKNFNAQDM